MSLDSRVIYKQLLERHGCIRIPMIQRDYAQGRPSEPEVREEFLNALERALLTPSDDPTLPLNLDFIYGSVEGLSDTRFLPLDGQQRLTTLFLLHWYLAWVDDQWDTFTQLFQADQRSKFAYSVRPTSSDFFDGLVRYRPTVRPSSVCNLAQLVGDQSWYFRSWRLDPTVQSVLCMLDAIHKRFVFSTGLFNRLIDEVQPAITFQLLDLENFGLSDDLYIKMNARGKPLTEFENFKARYEKELEAQFEDLRYPIGEEIFSTADYVSRRMDGAWTDLFWKLRDQSSNLFDGALMNVFRAVALVTRSPDSEKYLEDVSLLGDQGGRIPSYTSFHDRGWLDESFTAAVIHLLDAWSAESGRLSTLLPNARYFDERAIFYKIVANGANLLYTERVQFAAYASFLAKHQGVFDGDVFQEWMRIAYNLSQNTDYNRGDDFRRSIAGVSSLLRHSSELIKHFANSDNPVSGFNPQQVGEEKLKAKLILAHDGWRDLIDRAEGHGYFLGQIGFLLDFSGASAVSRESEPIGWDTAKHKEVQQRFLNYLLLSEQMFTESGLKCQGEYLWQRALLKIGDYTLRSGRNYSFLVDPKDDQASWKRLLRGTGENGPEAREVLHQLLDSLDPTAPLGPQLKRIVEEPADIEPWRAALVQTPQAIAYCEKRLYRWNSASEIYLLSRRQMNGEHAELFTFCLYYNHLLEECEAGRLHPLKLELYYFVSNTELKPGIRLTFSDEDHSAYFDLEFSSAKYRVFVHHEYLETWPELASFLARFGFSDSGNIALKLVLTDSILSELHSLAIDLAEAFLSS